MACHGNRTVACFTLGNPCNNGKSIYLNDAHIAYIWELVELVIQTNMNVFEFERGRYVGIDLCPHCRGAQVDGNRMCMSCVQGFLLYFPSSPTEPFRAPPPNWMVIDDRGVRDNFIRGMREDLRRSRIDGIVREHEIAARQIRVNAQRFIDRFRIRN